jgi:hypothetical protein
MARSTPPPNPRHSKSGERGAPSALAKKKKAANCEAGSDTAHEPVVRTHLGGPTDDVAVLPRGRRRGHGGGGRGAQIGPGRHGARSRMRPGGARGEAWLGFRGFGRAATEGVFEPVVRTGGAGSQR